MARLEHRSSRRGFGPTIVLGNPMTRLTTTMQSIAVSALLVATSPFPAFAQADYPNRTIRIIVPSAPSGGPDVLSRILAEKFTAKWGQTVVVENRPGGSNNI